MSPMCDHPVWLVQTTFEQVLPIADQAAALFYARLFTLDPTLRGLFHGDMQAQGRKLMTMLRVVVKGLNRLEVLLPALHELGRRHLEYGVTEAHYATVGAALLWTLEQGLGESFTPEVAAAWSTAYSLLAEQMQDVALSVA